MTRANGAIPAVLERDPAGRARFAPGGPEHLYVQQLQDGVALPRPQTPAYPAIIGRLRHGLLRRSSQGRDVRQALDAAVRRDRRQPRRQSDYRASES